MNMNELASMENLADISEPQLLPNKQKYHKILFSICLFRFQWEKFQN